MTLGDSFAIGFALALVLVLVVALPLAKWIVRRRVAAAARREADARTRQMFGAIVAGIYRRRPHGGFDMPPREIAKKRMIEAVVLELPGNGITIPAAKVA